MMYDYLNQETRNRINYTVICISEFAQRFSMNQQEAYQYLKRFGGLSFLKDCYDAEHLLSIEDAVDDLTIICKNHGSERVSSVEPHAHFQNYTNGMDRIRFLTEQIIQDVVGYLVEDRQIEYDKAIDVLYSSQVFQKLIDPACGLYLESSAYVYELLKSELLEGSIVQHEQ